jgi:hypothetical protein
VSRSYVWDLEKARINLAKHGVSFDEAATVDLDPNRRRWPDAAHDRDDDRFITIGHSRGGFLLFVITSERGPQPRMVSARRATKRERREYETRP